MTRSKSIKTLLTVATSVAMSSCGLADIVEQVQAQIEALNVSPESLQKLLAQSSKSFSVAGGQVAGNLNALGGGERQATAPAGSPSYAAAADASAPTSCEQVSPTADGKTIIIDFSGCTDRAGQIKLVLSNTEGKIGSEMTFTDYSEGAADSTAYVFYDGTMKWEMDLADTGMEISSNNAYTTKYLVDDSLAELYMTESMDLTYGDGGLVIEGTNTISEGDKTAILSFIGVTFDPATCPQGPSAGKINLKIGGDFIEISITACAEAIQVVSKDGEQTSTNLTGADLAAFFEEFAGNLNTFDGQLADAQSKVGFIEGAGLIKDCNSDIIHTDLAPFQGEWCQAYDAGNSNAYMFCIKLCNLDATKQFPDYFIIEGVGTWSGNYDADAPYGYINPAAIAPVCVDREFVMEHGIMKYGEQFQTTPVIDILLREPEMFGTEEPMPADDPFTPAAETAPRMSLPMAWALAGDQINEYTADYYTTGSYDLNSEVLIGGYTRVGDTVPSCTYDQISKVLGTDTSGGQDYCMQFPEDPICGGVGDYCMQYPEDPACGGDFCAQYPSDPSCGGGGETWCSVDPYSVECACEMDPTSYECDPVAFCVANPSDLSCQ